MEEWVCCVALRVTQGERGRQALTLAAGVRILGAHRKEAGEAYDHDGR